MGVGQLAGAFAMAGVRDGASVVGWAVGGRGVSCLAPVDQRWGSGDGTLVDE